MYVYIYYFIKVNFEGLIHCQMLQHFIKLQIILRYTIHQGVTKGENT